MKFQFNDGGRAAAGYKGRTGDCVCRSIAIATGKPYQEVYDELNVIAKTERKTKRRKGKSGAATGVYKPTIRRYMASLGWRWVPTMKIGQGCKVHLEASELPATGRLVVQVSKHLTAVIDGVIHDTHNPQRAPLEVFSGKLITGPDGQRRNEVVRVQGGRCVYGWWVKD